MGSSPTRVAVVAEGEECVASIKLKRTPHRESSTVHFMKNGNVVESVRFDITGSTGKPVVIDTDASTKYDSVVVMANYNRDFSDTRITGFISRRGNGLFFTA